MLQKVLVLPTDADFLFQLYRTTRLAELQAWGWDESMQQQFLHMQWRAQQNSYSAQYPNADHHVLHFQNLQAGRIMIFRSEDAILLVDITLLPAFQNQGIGTALLQELQSEAAASARPLRLNVLPGNPAQQLYERLGFRVINTAGLHITMEWQAQFASDDSKTIS